jgi:hypothetical protein
MSSGVSRVMPATVLSTARSFAIKTLIVIGSALAIFLGLYVFEMEHRLIALNQAKATIDGSQFKPGCYDCVDDEAMVSKILEVEETADLTFDGLALQRRDVRFGIADGLKNARHKDLLVVRSWCQQPDELANLRIFACAVGAKRLLVLASYSDAIKVMYDSAYRGKTEKPSGR